MERRYVRARWITVALFCLGCLATLNYNGPFFDEAIYITAGLRAFEGQGLTDLYLTWFAGTLTWPWLAALGYVLAGILGTRAIAVLLGTIVLAAVGKAATNLFDERTGFWTTLAFAINGAFVALARLGVYDIAALVGITGSFWAITELTQRDDRGWLILAAMAFAFATLTKYPTGLMLIPLAAILIVLRKQKASMDLTIFVFVAGAVGLAAYLPLREQISVFFEWRLQNSPGFGVSLSTIAFAIVYLSTAPALLAIIAWFKTREQRALASVLLMTLIIWPAYHLLASDPVGTNKHVVLGFVFIYPLVGLTLQQWWHATRWKAAGKAATVVTMLILAALGALQVQQANYGWPNLAFPARYLTEQVEPGDKLLINESRPFTLALYTNDSIMSPWDVYDEYRVTTEATAPDICDFDWVVDVKGSYSWPPNLARQLAACPDYMVVYRHTSPVINLGADFRYVSYPVDTVISHHRPERP